ncbi:hypothetical protein EPO05_06355 [Patescibacteria group bacterium]|nr:MAG: hypothetical protein EPO05_06355 [Patescibacteria group bacterium]
MTTVAPQNINQFALAPVRGQLDMQISARGVISGIISANEMSTLVAGNFLKLDSAVTVGNIPQFVAAAAGDKTIFVLTRTVKAATFVALDPCEVAFFGGPVIWEEASDTIAPGQQLQDDGSGFMEPIAASSLRGIALDPAVDGMLFRMILAGNLLVGAQ